MNDSNFNISDGIKWNKVAKNFMGILRISFKKFSILCHHFSILYQAAGLVCQWNSGLLHYVVVDASC